MGFGACKFLIFPLCLLGAPIFVVFYGGLHGWYTTDIRIAIGWMLGAFNVVSFLIHAIDKSWAMDYESSVRVPEVVLLYLTWAGGPIGALLGIICCNHKHSKGGFMGIFVVLFIFNWLWVFIYFIATAETSLAAAFKHSGR